MLRRLVVLKAREPLSLAWSSRNAAAAARTRGFSAAAQHLDSSVAVRGAQVDASYRPVRLLGRASGRTALPAAKGFNYAMSLAQESSYAIRVDFEDQDAIERMKQDKKDEVAGVYADVRIAPFLKSYCGNAAVGKASDVATKLGLSVLRKAGLTGKGVRVAIVDTGIDGNIAPVAGGWSPVPGYVPGSTGPDHGSMCAYDARIAAPDCRLLDYALLQSQAGGGWTGFLSDAVAGFAELLALLQAEAGPLVVNNSWGMFDRSDDAAIGSAENYSANPNHPFNQMAATLVAAGADVLFAAGNCGAQCADGRCGTGDVGPGASIHGANSHPDVVTVAAVTVKDRRLGYSSQGPGGLAARKPDIAAYSHFRGSGVYANDGGTSAACPVAAGVAAALRQKGPGRKLAPAQMKGLLQRSARDLDGNGWDYDIGYGVIDARAALKLLA